MPYRPLRTTVLYGAPPVVTGDPERDLLLHVLKAVEEREGERKGWDKKPQLWQLNMPRTYTGPHDNGQVLVQQIPRELWATRGRHGPGDDLERMTASWPDPPADLPPLAFADSPNGLAGVAFMSEAWTVPPDKIDEALKGKERGIMLASRADRIEMRFLTATDINNRGYGIGRIRGEQPHLLSGDGDAMEAAQGRVPVALSRLAWALRRGAWSPV